MQTIVFKIIFQERGESCSVCSFQRLEFEIEAFKENRRRKGAFAFKLVNCVLVSRNRLILVGLLEKRSLPSLAYVAAKEEAKLIESIPNNSAIQFTWSRGRFPEFSSVYGVHQLLKVTGRVSTANVEQAISFA